MNETCRKCIRSWKFSLIAPLPPNPFGISDTFFWNSISIVIHIECFFRSIPEPKVCAYVGRIAQQLKQKGKTKKTKKLFCYAIVCTLFWSVFTPFLFNLFEWSVHHCRWNCALLWKLNIWLVCWMERVERILLYYTQQHHTLGEKKNEIIRVLKTHGPEKNACRVSFCNRHLHGLIII